MLSSRMVGIRYTGEELGSRDRVEWTVTLWDEHDAPGEPSSSWFELGLLDAADWKAQWITGDYSPKRNARYPVDCFRRRFRTEKVVSRARLYITACGVYDAHLNGRRVGDVELAPGSTDYRKRLQYQAYDVTSLLAESNTLDVRLADGWYRGSIGAFGPTNVFGRATKFLAQLEVTYDDGTTESILSGDSFQWSNDGPLRFADLKDGEICDGNRTPAYGGRARVTKPAIVPTASDNVTARTKERFTAALLTTPSGARVLDFGQNIAGFVEFAVTARRGQRIRLRMGEMLDESGEFTQGNFQLHKPVKEFGRATEVLLMTGKTNLVRGTMQPTPKQQVDYLCADGLNRYRTSFAVFGFRYALIETDVEFDPTDFAAVAVYSDMEQTGEFECSNPDVNKLLDNTRWSMKGNFLDVPTDCPTRERLGWTGDAQVFFDTAAYLMDVTGFYRKWLRDLHDAQQKSGKVSAVVPYNGVAMMYDATGGSVGWADAAVLVPYRYWKRYGDVDLLRDFYPMMRDYAEYMISRTGHKNRKAAAANPFNNFVYEKGMHLGEWLEPEEFRDAVTGTSRPSRTEEATAYLHYTMRHLAEISGVLGESTDAARYLRYADGAKRAYNHLFVQGRPIDTDRQAKLVRPLALELLDAEVIDAVGERLVKAVENRDYRVGTGFLSTPFVLPVLTAIGRSDVAYRMLENEQAPSWLAEVKAGATTIWEDWEGKESHNHYSPGSVSQWLFDTVAGIRVDGENRFVIAPTPGGTLTHAGAVYTSQYGRVECAWEMHGGELRVRVVIPANTTAELRLSGAVHHLQPGEHEVTA
ncbi:glycoside hydrolase family 78 protein [Microbacterium sp. zg.Y625]|uniref:glycoside hydrolase family 78 protein n=1 Tax=Microbacterium jiangjiandongii TaxID=3049071 RepID=UPI00214B4BE1|nr:MULTISPECIES: glycoside hydrolase family 78 protein [unclassified Microbacterium]MCR2792736.1 glycoside hydrolase family 78 protein [Microbacterium sp. zg.Y625]WIM26714.1 glycoside hydrolase family 78 protein [Microbacterium sp. zg-Y625]